jgi:ribosomal protein L24E
MRHSRADNILLLGKCSYCNDVFGEGAGRLIIGDYSQEQFCSNECAEEFLETVQEKRRSSQSSSIIVKMRPLQRLKQ